MIKDYCTPKRRKRKQKAPSVLGLVLILLAYLAVALWVADRAGITIIL